MAEIKKICRGMLVISLSSPVSVIFLYIGGGDTRPTSTPQVHRPCMVGGHFFFCVPGRKSSLCVSRQEEFGTLVDGMYVRGCHFKELRIPQSYEFEVPGGRNV